MDETRMDASHPWTSPAGRPMVNTAEESDRLRQVDLCLQQVATALSEQIRPRDSRFLFRLGGDEFALVLPVPESAHSEMGARLESAVSRLAAEAYPTVDLHLDLGEAEVPREAADLQTALRLADARMYEAKRGRRERFMTVIREGLADSETGRVYESEEVDRILDEEFGPLEP